MYVLHFDVEAQALLAALQEGHVPVRHVVELQGLHGDVVEILDAFTSCFHIFQMLPI